MSDIPPVNFSQFIVSIASSALVHLGEIKAPDSDAASVDLTLAKHSIDLLAVLKTKTTGNLEPDELKLLDAVLTDLRTKYLSAEKST